MKKCYDCTHVEMCGWRKEVKEQGCEFFDDGMVWIPCSERLPSEEGRYMITHKAFSNMTFIDMFYYGKPLMPNCKVKGWCWYRSDDEWGDVVYDDADILAWMPLPTPYKEESEE